MIEQCLLFTHSFIYIIYINVTIYTIHIFTNSEDILGLDKSNYIAASNNTKLFDEIIYRRLER